MLDPRIISTVRRYLGYGWNASLIQSLVRFRFNAPLKARCIRNIRDNLPCTAKCMESCPVKEAELWFLPEFEAPQE